MTTLEDRGSRVEDVGLPISGEVVALPGAAGWPGQLVLPEDVVAGLAAQLVARAKAGEPVKLTGAGGLLSGVIGQVLQAGLALELDQHLQASGDGNGRNGYTAKTLKTEAGPVAISVPRDRAGSFEPVLVPQGGTPHLGHLRHRDRPVCGGHERPGYRPARSAHDGDRAVARHDLQDHR